MPNVFTKVPERPVPPLPGWARALLPAADRFMVVMISRPPTGTLATTWVTPATLLLSAALAVVALLCAGFLVAGFGVERLFLGILLIAFGLGCAAVGLVGLAQRRSG